MVAWNRKIYQSLVMLVLSVVLVFGGASVGRAEETDKSEQVTVIDDASLLFEEEIDGLKTRAEALAEHTGWHIVIATCEDADGKTAQTVCEEYYNTYAEGEDGISCLIDMDNREIYIATSGEAISYLTDGRIEDLLDDAYEEISQEHYMECFDRMLEGAESAYNKGIPDNSVIYNEDTGEKIVNRQLTGGEFLIALLVAAAVFLAVFFGIIGKYRLKWGTYKYDFHQSGSMELTKERDHFINQVVTHRHIPKNDDSSSSGSSHTSTTHTGAGGNNFGGGGRKF